MAPDVSRYRNCRRPLKKTFFGIQVDVCRPALCSAVGLDADPVVDRVFEPLLAAKIPLGRLDGDVAQQKLDLVQLASGLAAQAGTGSTQVMRGQIFNGRSLGAVFGNMPYDPLRYAISPRLAGTAYTPKHAAFVHASRYKPAIDGALDPIRNRDRPNVPALANQIPQWPNDSRAVEDGRPPG